MVGRVWYSPGVFAKPIYSFVLLFASVLALLASSFGGSSAIYPFWPGALSLACVSVIGAFAIARGFHGRANLWCIGFAVMFIMWIVIRGAMSEVVYLARPDMIFAIAAFTGYTLMAGQFETVNERRWILVALFLVLVGNVTWATIQSNSGDSATSIHSVIGRAFPWLGEKLGWTDYTSLSDGKDPSGFYVSENHFAGMLELTALPALAFFLMSRAGFAARAVALIIYLIGLYGAKISTSRLGMVCLLGGSLFVIGGWWFSRMKLGKQSTRTTVIIGGVLGVVLVCGMIFGASKLIKQQHGNYINSNELTVRLSYSKAAWEQFLKRPVDGTGARSFEYEERVQRSLNVENWMWYGDIDTDAVFAHDDWLQLFGDYGGIGGVLGILVVGSHLLNGLAFVFKRSQFLSAADVSSRQDDRLGLTLGAVGGVVALCVHSVLDFNMHIAANTVFAGLLLGFLANPGRESLKNSVDQEGDALVPRQGLWLRIPLISISLVGGGFILLHGPDWFRADRAAQAGEKMREKDNYYESSAALNEAIKLDPAHFPAHMTLGLLNMDEAARIKENYRPRNKQEQEMNDKVQMSFLRRACEVFEAGYPLYPQYPYLCMQAGSCFSERRDFESAELWFSRAFQFGKASRRLYFQYGQHLIRKALLSSDIATQIELGEKAMNQYYKPAREKLRSGGEYQKLIDEHIAEITKWLNDLRAAQQAKTQPAPAPDAAPAPAPAPQ